MLYPLRHSLILCLLAGTGKTTCLRHISNQCAAAGIPLRSAAMTGVASGSLRYGMTVHSSFGIPVDQSTCTNRNLSNLMDKKLHVLLADLQDALDTGVPLAVILDEMSMVTAVMLGHVLRRIQEMNRNLGNNPKPGLFIMCGDFHQIRPVAGVPLFETVLRIYVEEESVMPVSPADRGSSFFRHLRLFRLDKQQRATDELQASIVDQLRTIDPAVYPMSPGVRSPSLIGHYKIISAVDVRASPRWDQTPVLVPLNIVRHEYSRLRMIRYAKCFRVPILAWRNILTGKEASGLSAQELNQLFASHPALCGFYVQNMICFLNENINPVKGFGNGSMAFMHSLCLDPKENLAELKVKIATAEPGSTIVLGYPPLFLNVRLANAIDNPLRPADTLLPGESIVPVPLRSRSKYEPIKRWEVLHRIEDIEGIRYRSICVDVGFAITFDKAQSKTLSTAILDFTQWPHMNLSFERVLVGLTRVKNTDDNRIMPLPPGGTFEHLYKLKPDPRMLCWLKGFSKDGILDLAVVKAALDRLPKAKPKRKPISRPTNFKEPSSDQAPLSEPISSSPPEQPDASTGRPKPRRKPRGSGGDLSDGAEVNTESAETNPRSAEAGGGILHQSARAVSGNPRVVAQFYLDCLIPNTRRTKYSAFHVKPDGSCLFTSFITALNLSVTVPQIRKQVVDHIADIRIPARRMGLLNEHMIRTPGWEGEVLFDPSDARAFESLHFTELWVRYMDEMLKSVTWAGNGELIALCELYSVNAIVWVVKDGVAAQSSPYRHDPVSATTVHLHLGMNERHFETTDIPSDFMPPMVRRSSRESKRRADSPPP